ncbi:MAG: hypothetical protein AAGH19_09405 [Pseudomonadota bacterium]
MSVAVAQAGLFTDLPPRNRSPLPVRWILLAVLVHGVLIFTWKQPLHDPLPPRLDRSVSVQLEPTANPTVIEESSEPMPPSMPAPPKVTPAPAAPTARDSSPPPAASAPEPQQTAPAATITLDPLPEPPEAPLPESLDTQRLLETIAAMDWSDPETPRHLARSTDSDTLEGLRRPLLPGADNRFGEAYAPASNEVVDNWLGADGTQQVVIRAPDGNTYCGRQGPVDDMRPWLQMPMLFHRCAGGGKRRAGSSWRNN